MFPSQPNFVTCFPTSATVFMTSIVHCYKTIAIITLKSFFSIRHFHSYHVFALNPSIIRCFTEAEESLISYLSGWLARKCSICMECQVVLPTQLGDHSYCRSVTMTLLLSNGLLALLQWDLLSPATSCSLVFMQ